MTTNESFIDCQCPYCGETVSFREDIPARLQECPNCSESLVVPRTPSEFAGKPPLPITTPRLSLRRLTTADWKDLLEFLSDEELFQFLETGPTDEEHLIEWLERDGHVKLTTPGTMIRLGMELRPQGKVIGAFYFQFPDALRVQADFAVFVNRSFQRQGFATEAVKGALDFWFAGIGLHRVTVSCDSRNTAACRLFEKTGLRREGELLQDRFVNAEWVNTVWYGLLDKEYWQSKGQVS